MMSASWVVVASIFRLALIARLVTPISLRMPIMYFSKICPSLSLNGVKVFLNPSLKFQPLPKLAEAFVTSIRLKGGGNSPNSTLKTPASPHIASTRSLTGNISVMLLGMKISLGGIKFSEERFCGNISNQEFVESSL